MDPRKTPNRYLSSKCPPRAQDHSKNSGQNNEAGAGGGGGGGEVFHAFRLQCQSVKVFGSNTVTERQHRYCAPPPNTPAPPPPPHPRSPPPYTSYSWIVPVTCPLDPHSRLHGMTRSWTGCPAVVGTGGGGGGGRVPGRQKLMLPSADN